MSTGRSAVVLYGPPASGKDTITAALASADPRFRLYRRLKVGAGRTTGYRMASANELAELDAADAVIYSNRRYSSTYVIDRPELDTMLSAGDIPVVHVGQVEAVDALLAADPATRWTVIELWCPRDVAELRSEGRNTGDTAERLAAWDSTPHLTIADCRIDTSVIAAADAAQQITAAVSAAACTVVVPALHLVSAAGTLDISATHRYAEAAARGWTDYFLLNGSTASGHALSDEDRTAVLDTWLEVVEPSRLLACSWSANDLRGSADRGITPMAVMKVPAYNAAQQFLKSLPPGSMIYSHPELFGQSFSPELAKWARAAGLLPLGGKLAKIQHKEIAELRRVAPEFAVLDGSSRQLRQSMEAGATGVVATPLAGMLATLPPRNLAVIQSVIDAVQAELDQLPSRTAKREWLLGLV